MRTAGPLVPATHKPGITFYCNLQTKCSTRLGAARAMSTPGPGQVGALRLCIRQLTRSQTETNRTNNVALSCKAEEGLTAACRQAVAPPDASCHHDR